MSHLPYRPNAHAISPYLMATETEGRHEVMVQHQLGLVGAEAATGLCTVAVDEA
jgi:hypothetical protein